MNIENILATAGRLSDLDDHEFCQRKWSFSCGTPACIAGHAAMLAIETDKDFVSAWLEACKLPIYETEPNIPDLQAYRMIGNNIFRGTRYLAKAWLDLNEYEAESIFDQAPHVKGCEDVFEPTPEQASRMLMRFVKTGYVIEWHK